ncbi:MAG: DNA polymerase III subunit gamma/tau [Gammaproteobacteria bacterium]|nr:DNA polymerase III subunit gamma/tau [Gammaproteobacteria bacterium]MBU1725856.1 DNA polymerase III subunit gamma/tau [Gammaproteobacteria bacterium]MBU2005156.1 DNA polymerase III subunit gamma/tau [Gammaproteobacteria bacterium]
MSYQVLARKWRPQDFQQMVGQSHVLRALMNALEGDEGHQRLHHAYLFTGTRGVGKTTLARIFAKCLNCETGVTAKPCGECRSCKEIAEGRHVDLIEVDAASRTKVEDTRDLLDNVQYAPTRGRFKIYLIDEVHMLSGHSFNALLKTLEEPPPHVKFLFATTDPQKLPVTILSRCLQFNLKRMPVDMISGHLAKVLEQENIPFSDSALRLLARAADGSMRDALSLTDQAIVAGGGAVSEDDVQDMLGLLPHEHLVALLQSVADDDGKRMLQTVTQMAQLTTDFTTAADSLISLLHGVAVQQVVAADEADADVAALAKLLSLADVQLYYQMALHGRRDLPLAPDPRSGFEMMLLRMLAFRIDDGKVSQDATNSTQVEKKKILIEEASSLPATFPERRNPSQTLPLSGEGARGEVLSSSSPDKGRLGGVSSSNDWHAILPLLNLSGMALPLAQHCLLESVSDEQITLLLDEGGSTLQSPRAEAQLAEALAKHYGRELKLSFKLTTLTEETPEKRNLREAAEKQAAAEEAIRNDPFVQQLQEAFGATIVPGSIRPRTETGKL